MIVSIDGTFRHADDPTSSQASLVKIWASRPSATASAIVGRVVDDTAAGFQDASSYVITAEVLNDTDPLGLTLATSTARLKMVNDGGRFDAWAVGDVLDVYIRRRAEIIQDIYVGIDAGGRFVVRSIEYDDETDTVSVEASERTADLFGAEFPAVQGGYISTTLHEFLKTVNEADTAAYAGLSETIRARVAASSSYANAAIAPAADTEPMTAAELATSLAWAVGGVADGRRVAGDCGYSPTFGGSPDTVAVVRDVVRPTRRREIPSAQMKAWPSRTGCDMVNNIVKLGTAGGVVEYDLRNGNKAAEPRPMSMDAPPWTANSAANCAARLTELAGRWTGEAWEVRLRGDTSLEYDDVVTFTTKRGQTVTGQIVRTVNTYDGGLETVLTVWELTAAQAPADVL